MCPCWSDFVTATISKAPKGWIAAGSQPKSYEMSLFADFCHSGSKCARLCSTTDAINGFGTLMQSVKADGYRGKRIKLTAFIKSGSVDDWAGLWMRVDAGPEIVSFDNMQNRPIKGETDWTQYHVVLDVTEQSTNISFGVLLSGAGALWLDDFALEVVGLDVPSTGVSADIAITGGHGELKQNKKPSSNANEKSLLAKPRNLDFEEGEPGSTSGAHSLPIGWMARGSHPENYKMYVDGATEFAGGKCALIESLRDPQVGFGTLMQTVYADFCLGEKMRLSAQIKSEEVGWAALWMRIDGADGEILGFDNMQENPINGTTDWNSYECVLDVPLGAKSVAFGVLMSGEGKVWFSEVVLEPASDDVEVTDTKADIQARQQPVNMCFEE
jgi:hypothetical protein